MAGIFVSMTGWLGARLSRYLSQPSGGDGAALPTDPAKLMACLQPGDVLLVEGKARISVAIKYLTQSTWSHAALYAGDVTGLADADADGSPRCFLEANLQEGVRAVSVAEYEGLHCRVCRPVGLGVAEIDTVIEFVKARLGYQYDLKNVFDLVRYLLPTPPVPTRWRRRMLALGSGDPTRAICSTLIAQAFQSVSYPILPVVESIAFEGPDCSPCVKEMLYVRHHSLFVPRDFDVSPYFAIIKPTLAAGFDYRALAWQESHAQPALPMVARRW
ncbi:MAG: YiiX/YebB-like N1pC/P60 family cysteine hydrolase [Burkholderiaceae bacterium]|nr:YiiX/YebB-like N1pC/P60 family cysteine hydrolase [Burkholderiaceae bacterium]